MPYPVNPTRAANPNKMMSAIFPPFPCDFLVVIETIPPDSISIATKIPIEPDDPPFPSSVFTTPAAQD